MHAVPERRCRSGCRTFRWRSPTIDTCSQSPSRGRQPCPETSGKTFKTLVQGLSECHCTRHSAKVGPYRVAMTIHFELPASTDIGWLLRIAYFFPRERQLEPYATSFYKQSVSAYTRALKKEKAPSMLRMVQSIQSIRHERKDGRRTFGLMLSTAVVVSIVVRGAPWKARRLPSAMLCLQSFRMNPRWSPRPGSTCPPPIACIVLFFHLVAYTCTSLADTRSAGKTLRETAPLQMTAVHTR